MGQLNRLQTDYDRLSLRNDLGLTKLELEQIAKRMVPPPAKVLLPFVYPTQIYSIGMARNSANAALTPITTMCSAGVTWHNMHNSIPASDKTSVNDTPTETIAGNTLGLPMHVLVLHLGQKDIDAHQRPFGLHWSCKASDCVRAQS